MGVLRVDLPDIAKRLTQVDTPEDLVRSLSMRREKFLNMFSPALLLIFQFPFSDNLSVGSVTLKSTDRQSMVLCSRVRLMHTCAFGELAIVASTIILSVKPQKVPHGVTRTEAP